MKVVQVATDTPVFILIVFVGMLQVQRTFGFDLLTEFQYLCTVLKHLILVVDQV